MGLNAASVPMGLMRRTCAAAGARRAPAGTPLPLQRRGADDPSRTWRSPRRRQARRGLCAVYRRRHLPNLWRSVYQLA